MVCSHWDLQTEFVAFLLRTIVFCDYGYCSQSCAESHHSLFIEMNSHISFMFPLFKNK